MLEILDIIGYIYTYDIWSLHKHWGYLELMEAYIEIENMKIFKKFIDIINDLSSFVTFWCSNSKLEITTMSASSTCMISMKLFPSFFSTFSIQDDLNSEDIFKMNLPLSELNAIVKILKNAVPLSIQTDPNIHTINFLQNLSGYLSQFSIKLLDIQNQYLIDSICLEQYDYKVVMSSDMFEYIFSSSKTVDDSIKITCYPEKICFETVSQNSISSYKSEKLFDEPQETVSLKPFEVEFFSKSLKIISQLKFVTHTVTLHLSSYIQGKPLLLRYSCANSTFDIVVVFPQKFNP